ncbi:unnamed protein product [Closterium sp. NIES-53]
MACTGGLQQQGQPQHSRQWGPAGPKCGAPKSGSASSGRDVGPCGYRALTGPDGGTTYWSPYHSASSCYRRLDDLHRERYGPHAIAPHWPSRLRQRTTALVEPHPPGLRPFPATRLPLVWHQNLSLARVRPHRLHKFPSSWRHTCTDLGELQHYLGLQITRDKAACIIAQTQSLMVEQILTWFRFPFSKVHLTPLAVDHGLTAPPSDESFESSGPYPKLASSVSGSSCEAEVYTTAMVTQELCWLSFLLTGLGEGPCSPPILFADNRSAVRQQPPAFSSLSVLLVYQWGGGGEGMGFAGM